MKFLKDIKTKLRETKTLNEVELESFNNVLHLLSMDSLYNVEFAKQPNKEIDLEVIAFLKYKFSLDGQSDGNKENKKGSKKDPVQMVQASEFLKTSSISAHKTKMDIVAMFEKGESQLMFFGNNVELLTIIIFFFRSG